MQYTLLCDSYPEVSGRLFLTWNDETKIFATGNTAGSVLSPAKADIVISCCKFQQLEDTKATLGSFEYRDFADHQTDQPGRERSRSARLR